METSQTELIKEFYLNNPNRDIQHQEAVDWLTAEYLKRTGKVFRDPDRGIRKLYAEGTLIKVTKGVYKYDPAYTGKNRVAGFSPEVKLLALERDNYKCVWCGRGLDEGEELCVDHIIPQDDGGPSTLDNAQILCSRHNILKKNLKQTESGKKMFIRMYELAKKENHKELIKFCSEILETYEKHNINGHIEWTR